MDDLSAQVLRALITLSQAREHGGFLLVQLLLLAPAPAHVLRLFTQAMLPRMGRHLEQARRPHHLQCFLGELQFGSTFWAALGFNASGCLGIPLARVTAVTHVTNT